MLFQPNPLAAAPAQLPPSTAVGGWLAAPASRPTPASKTQILPLLCTTFLPSAMHALLKHQKTRTGWSRFAATGVRMKRRQAA